MQKNILITGGLGFIGSNLASALLKKGNLLFIVDDLSTGRYENLTWLYRTHKEETKQKMINFIQCDITDTGKFVALMGKNLGFKLDEIYHLACPASPPKYFLDPLKTLDTNYTGTKNVLTLARKYDSRILFTSTSEIYGDALIHPQPETYNGNVDPTSPRSCYDEGKRVAEFLVSEFHRSHKVDTRIARIFNSYGPRMDPDDGRVVTNFIKQILNNERVTLYGDGKQTRSFCYVDDQVRGLTTLMNSDLFRNEPVNIGNPHEISMIELAHEIHEIVAKELFVNQNLNFELKPLPVSDPKKRRPDISKMKMIGWEPQVCLADGLKETILYIKERLDPSFIR